MMPEPTRFCRTPWARFGKRPFDIVASAVLIVLCSPILLLSAAVIKMTSPGPLLFKHQRAGRLGKPFEPFKFRTMHHGRRSDAVELVPLDHPEITRVGRFLRRYKIDELPQIFNVLFGQMSLVGPRPDLLEHVEEYTPFKRQRLLGPPGLTGMAQVNGATHISWDERIRYDVYYLAHCTFAMDVGILLKTVGVVLRGESAYSRPFEASPYFDPADTLGWSGSADPG